MIGRNLSNHLSFTFFWQFSATGELQSLLLHTSDVCTVPSNSLHTSEGLVSSTKQEPWIFGGWAESSPHSIIFIKESSQL